MSEVTKSHEKEFQDTYVLSKMIGHGNFSVVRLCRHKKSKSKYSAKIMAIKGSDDECTETMDIIKTEVSILRKVNHEFILQFIDVYFELERAIIVTELAEHGDLHDFALNNPDKMDEVLAQIFASHVASAVKYMHSLSIVHRDIKPENFLLFKNKHDENYSLKVCDFGLAEEVPTYGGLTRTCGSPSFVAPEILERKIYSFPVDIWSMGVLFYFLISQNYPFSHRETNVLFDMIIKGDIHFTSRKWDNVSDNVKQLISLMLQKNPKRRIIAKDVLDQAWFCEKSFVVDIAQKKRLTFKSTALAVTGTSILKKYETCRLPRENAILSPAMLH